MSEWIKNREPVQADGNEYGQILITTPDGHVCCKDFQSVTLGTPWMPLPMPYVNRYDLVFYSESNCSVRDAILDNRTVFFGSKPQAEAVCKALNEVDP